MTGSTSPLGFPYLVSGDPVTDLPSVMQQLAEAVDDYLTALAAVAAVDWTDLPMAPGWAQLGDVGYGVEKSQYGRRAGVVTLVLAQIKTSWTAGVTVATVPSGFRPSRVIRFVAGINGAGEFMTVHPDGTVTADASGSVGITGTVTYPV